MKRWLTAAFLAAVSSSVIAPRAEADILDLLTVSFFDSEHTTIPGAVFAIDGLTNDNDHTVNNQIHLKPLFDLGYNDYRIDVINPANPVVVASATKDSVQLTLTNLKITSLSDSISGRIFFSGNWDHNAGDGAMAVSVHGTFAPGAGSTVADSYSVTQVGKIGDNSLTVGPLTGPKAQNVGEDFGDSKSKPITLPAGTDDVSGSLKFSLGRKGSSLTFMDSADVAAAIPEPSPLVLGGTGALCWLAYLGRRRQSLVASF